MEEAEIERNKCVKGSQKEEGWSKGEGPGEGGLLRAIDSREGSTHFHTG